MLAFHTLSSHHLEQVARALIKNGANLEAQMNSGHTALMLSAQNGHEQVRSSEVEKQIVVSEFFACLHTYSSHHLEQVARALIEAKADLEKQTAKGSTALILAAQNGHEQVARAMIEGKANLEVQDSDQVTALNAACYGSHVECAILLLRAGAHADAMDRFGDTPKSLAQQKGLEDVLALM